MIHHHVMWTDGEPLIRRVVRTYAIVWEYMAQGDSRKNRKRECNSIGHPSSRQTIYT